MIGPDVCLYRDMDHDYDNYRFHGRDGIYVRSLSLKEDSETHQTQGSNCRGTVPLVCYLRTEMEQVFWPDARSV